MKTFVVPTDFSPAAAHAAAYAAELAKQLQASVTLVHVYQLPVTMNDFPLLVVSVDELKHNADAALKRAREEAAKAAPDVVFTTESRLGDVVDEVNDVCQHNEVLALIAGAKNTGGFERFLLGNTALSFVRNAHLPVITVPEGAVISKPANMALALDFLHPEEVPVERINQWTALLQASLHLIHVEEDGRPLTTENVPPGLRYTSLHSLKQDDVTEGLRQFVATKNIDLLLVLPHKHNLYERLFFKGHTADIISTVPVPVMCIR